MTARLPGTMKAAPKPCAARTRMSDSASGAAARQATKRRKRRCRRRMYCAHRRRPRQHRRAGQEPTETTCSCSISIARRRAMRRGRRGSPAVASATTVVSMKPIADARIAAMRTNFSALGRDRIVAQRALGHLRRKCPAGRARGYSSRHTERRHVGVSHLHPTLPALKRAPWRRGARPILPG